MFHRRRMTGAINGIGELSGPFGRPVENAEISMGKVSLVRDVVASRNSP